MSLLKEFKEFAIKGNVVDLAVAVVIGGAFGKIVTAFVSDLVMPLVNALTSGGDWRELELTSLHFKVGDLLGTVVDFLIVAAVVFVVIQKLIGAMNKVMPAHEAPPATKQCPECLENVPKAARRCRACTSIFVALLLLLTSGNSQTTNASFGVNASRKQGKNKLALEGVYVYGKSNSLG